MSLRRPDIQFGKDRMYYTTHWDLSKTHHVESWTSVYVRIGLFGGGDAYLTGFLAIL